MRFFTLPTLAFGSALCLAVAACAVSYPIAPADASAGGSASGGFSATGGNGGTGGTDAGTDAGTGGIAGTGGTGGIAGTGGTGGIAGTGGTGGIAGTGGTGGIAGTGGAGGTGGSGACQGVKCTTPPAAGCANVTTRRGYISPGTCSSGTCSYGHTDVACPYVCSGGACTGVCKPGTKRCSGNGVETCSTSGAWSTAAACALATPQCSGAGLCGAPPSCQTPGPGRTDCGPGKESCCTSPLVKGGTFYRSYDGVGYTNKSYPATVSNFRLDKYEITVGRFRKFVEAWDKGWRPAGSGKHAYLNGGKGLSDSSKPGSYESGWSTTWNMKLVSHKATWDLNLSGDGYSTWTSSPGANERRPINEETWYEAYAFCIWDGGFLPSEAEWNYAASGGSEQRVYPWSNPPSSTTVDCSYADYYSCPGGSTNVGSESPKGDGRWGQSDLAGNVWDWTLDQYSSLYAFSCNNCAYLASVSYSYRVNRGGSFLNYASSLIASYRVGGTPAHRNSDIGARCARTP